MRRRRHDARQHQQYYRGVHSLTSATVSLCTVYPTIHDITLTLPARRHSTPTPINTAAASSSTATNSRCHQHAGAALEARPGNIRPIALSLVFNRYGVARCGRWINAGCSAARARPLRRISSLLQCSSYHLPPTLASQTPTHQHTQHTHTHTHPKNYPFTSLTFIYHLPGRHTFLFYHQVYFTPPPPPPPSTLLTFQPTLH